ncbi:hypothetical protein B0H10DRAFT_1965313 [Mycena sp. CBHHK59/15]|nr:hypothetical protein B0H10DRAFT_1965313 [Mycena sp. CBHHK59/15]
MFKLSITAVLVALSMTSASTIQACNTLLLHNRQNIMFDYWDSIAPEANLFGMGLLHMGAVVPETVSSDGWEGPVVLNILDQDVIPAMYLLQYPFFENGSSYSASFASSFSCENGLNIRISCPNLPIQYHHS